MAAIACVALFASATAAGARTLEHVRERGFLVCAAVAPLAGFAQQDGEGRWSGFDVDICRAIAAAVLGDPNLLEFRPLRGSARFVALQTGEIDVIVRNAPWTHRRDTIYGAIYVTQTFYDGQAFLVPTSSGLVSAYEMDGLSVCVLDTLDARSRMREFFFETQSSYREVVYEDVSDLGAAYRQGQCDVLSASGRELNAIRRDLNDPTAHRILPERISKELLGPVVAEGDDIWFDIVRWTVFTLLNAEEVGLTAANTDSLVNTRTPAVRRILGLENDYGAPLGLRPTFMADIIRAVGNYGEIYERHFGSQTGTPLLRGQNSLWLNGGLMFAPPVR
jgi:general L-amino acid transport system substrate-binding protein